MNINNNSTTKTNRFSGGCTTNPHKVPDLGKSACKCNITDIRWYPDEKKLVIEKPNRPDIVVNLNDVIPQEPIIKENIFIWNPITEKRETIVPEGTSMTVAIEQVVKAIERVEPMIKRNIFSFNPISGQKDILIVEKDTGYTDTIQKVVDEINDNFQRNFVWKEWDDRENTEGNSEG